jgi:hypothetical protein
VARQRWYQLARRGIYIRTGTAFLILAPLIPATIVLGPIAGGLLGVVALLIGLPLIGWRTHKDRGQPLLLAGRVMNGPHAIEDVPLSEKPDSVDFLTKFVHYGHITTITVQVRAAARLNADGSLDPAPDRHGEQEIGVHRRLRKYILEGEHSVLLCAGGGMALYQLGQLTASTSSDVGRD